MNVIFIPFADITHLIDLSWGKKKLHGEAQDMESMLHGKPKQLWVVLWNVV